VREHAQGIEEAALGHAMESQSREIDRLPIIAIVIEGIAELGFEFLKRDQSGVGAFRVGATREDQPEGQEHRGQ